MVAPRGDIMKFDPIKIIREFGSDVNWEDKENANKFNSYSKLRGRVADEAIKLFASEDLYPPPIMRLHDEGYMHIHDLGDAIVPYCQGHDLSQLLAMGLPTHTVTAVPPKHLDSFFDQLNNFLMVFQLERAGAQAVANLNTYAAPFVRKLHDYLAQFISDEEQLEAVFHRMVKQIVQRFLYNVNFPARGSQTAFINITLDIKCPEFLRDRAVLNHGCEGLYGDYEKEIRLLLQIFNELYFEGDGSGRPFTFPIVTIAVYPSTDFSDPLWVELMKTQRKFGTYSIYNYIGTGHKPNSIWSLCCHLALNAEQLPATGGRWAFEGGVGSIGVVTLNLSKIGHVAKGSNEDFFDILDVVLDAAKQSLVIKIDYIENHKELLMPLTMEFGFNQARYFRTIGVLGLNEMCMNLHGVPLREDVDFAEEVLTYIREWTRKIQTETKVPWNFEETPGEGSATRLAMLDKEMYGDDIFCQGVPGAWYYSTMIVPPNAWVTFGERLRIEERLLQLFTGGVVFRIFLGEANPSPEALVKLTERIAKETKISFFDFACQYSFCVDCKLRIPGLVESCHKCGGITIPYARIVGYYRPIYNANIGKIREILERTRYIDFEHGETFK